MGEFINTLKHENKLAIQVEQNKEKEAAIDQGIGISIVSNAKDEKKNKTDNKKSKACTIF